MSDTEKSLSKMTTNFSTEECDPLSGVALKLGALGFACFFLVISTNSILRGLRDSLVVEGGSARIASLLAIVFWVMLAATPLFGYIVSRFRKRLVAPIVYAFFVANILAFSLAIEAGVPLRNIGSIFFVWLSVFNLFVVAIFWVVMTDIFSLEQGKRLFGYIAAGGTIGGIAGSTSASFLAPAIGVNGLFLCAAILLTCIALGILAIYAIVSHAGVQVGLDQSIGQSPLSGLFAILQSPYLLTIAIWVVLGNVVTTFLYLQQAELLARSFPLAAERAAFLYRVDAIVSVCAILMQLTVMAWLVTRFGVGIATATQGVAAVVGFFAFVVTPGLMTAVWAQGAVRATAFGISLPARHLLFSVVSIDEKYKSQSAIDTLAHRGGDAAGGAIYQWLSRGLGLEASILAMIGGGAAVMWATIAVMFTPMMRRRSDRGMSEGGR